MNAEDFKRILTTFADREADLDLERGRILVQIREEIIEVRITSKFGNIQVEEGGSTVSAEHWIIDRVARLRQLADRLLTFSPQEEHFIAPSGLYLDHLDRSPDEKPRFVKDVVLTLSEALSESLGGTSSIFYLTSDAGEGKTTVINKLAYQQANLYKEGKTDWLLVPIALGGRTFLRLDDVTIGALVNRFRFPFLFYDSFIELVRLGVLIPALDGFEEMFVETATGDAVSALGNLVQALRSAGTVLIAARKAYFEYQSLQTQSRLYESLKNCSVAFAKLSINRWERQHFVDYCRARGISNPEDAYNQASSVLQPGHPVLTRAVLVARLVDVMEDAEDIAKVYERLNTHKEDSPTEFFDHFVNTIVEREVGKWIDKSGTPARPLLNISQQHDLLSDIAEEMWTSNTNALRGEVMDFISEIFCERNALSPFVSRQVLERAKQHSLITSAEEQPGAFRFDHEEFFHFFLGRVLFRRLMAQDLPSIRNLVRSRPVPPLSLDIAAHHLKGNTDLIKTIINSLVATCQTESKVSCMRENCGAIAVRLASNGICSDIDLDGLAFPADSLKGKTFRNVSFKDGYFYPTDLDHTRLEKCRFERCEFQRLAIKENIFIADTIIQDSTIHCLFLQESERHIYGPDEIAEHLSRHGFGFPEEKKILAHVKPARWDAGLGLTERALRAFWRATEVNENIFRMRLGSQANDFCETVLPKLRDSGIFTEVPYRGSGKQKRYKLSIRMETLNKALSQCEGSFDRFLALAAESMIK